jgi:hypothetical protein
VLDRLEEGGFVRRVRDPHDRRRVIVELGGGPGLREIGPVFGPVVKAWRATAASYSDDELRLLLEFQGRLEQIMRDHLARPHAGILIVDRYLVLNEVTIHDPAWQSFPMRKCAPSWRARPRDGGGACWPGPSCTGAATWPGGCAGCR